LGSAVRRRRLERACQDLETTDDPIAAIAACWRFSDASHLTRTFRHSFGVPPSDFRMAPRSVSEADNE
jgi:AraC-like DNA-binding protein